MAHTASELVARPYASLPGNSMTAWIRIVFNAGPRTVVVGAALGGGELVEHPATAIALVANAQTRIRGIGRLSQLMAAIVAPEGVGAASVDGQPMSNCGHRVGKEGRPTCGFGSVGRPSLRRRCQIH